MSYEEYLAKAKEGIVTDQNNCPVTPLLVMPRGKRKTQWFSLVDALEWLPLCLLNL